MWHELQQMNAADGILTILKQTQREEIRTAPCALRAVLERRTHFSTISAVQG